MRKLTCIATIVLIVLVVVVTLPEVYAEAPASNTNVTQDTTYLDPTADKLRIRWKFILHKPQEDSRQRLRISIDEKDCTFHKVTIGKYLKDGTPKILTSVTFSKGLTNCEIDFRDFEMRPNGEYLVEVIVDTPESPRKFLKSFHARSNEYLATIEFWDYTHKKFLEDLK